MSSGQNHAAKFGVKKTDMFWAPPEDLALPEEGSPFFQKPRTTETAPRFVALVTSIVEEGVINPLRVFVDAGDRRIVVAGRNRHRATVAGKNRIIAAGKKYLVPYTVTRDEDLAYEWMLAENAGIPLTREYYLDEITKARDRQHTDEWIAEKMGLTVADVVRLGKTPRKPRETRSRERTKPAAATIRKLAAKLSNAGDTETGGLFVNAGALLRYVLGQAPARELGIAFERAEALATFADPAPETKDEAAQ